MSVTEQIPPAPSRTRAAIAVCAVVLATAVAAATVAFTPSFVTHAAERSADEAPASVVENASELGGSDDGTVHAGTWTLEFNEPVWGQTRAVEAVNILPALPGPGTEWVLADVSVTNNSATTASMSMVDIFLRLENPAERAGYRGTYRAPFTEFDIRQRVPEELDTSNMAPGETRTGKIGWIIASSMKDSPVCAFDVEIKDGPFDMEPEETSVAC